MNVLLRIIIATLFASLGSPVLPALGYEALARASVITPATSHRRKTAPARKKTAARPKQKSTQKKSRLTVGEIREAEQRLYDLGYWGGPVDGVFDPKSRQALIAFEKVEGLARGGKLTRQELEALRSAKRPKPRQGGPFHVEVDLTRQVLFVVDESGVVSKVLPVSTGNNELFTSEDWTRRACTPTGTFRIYRKLPGWRKSPLGMMYCPNYFVGGVAIHGSPSVPVKAASHGCIRIPMYAAEEFSAMIPIGTPLIVHSPPQPCHDWDTE
ncbi:MAG TPA: L,D-transpeptidase family protein [Blastocatellia bacterium]|nr:L,D-transpeptidase family protein [Blastocatellia bacterium]